MIFFIIQEHPFFIYSNFTRLMKLKCIVFNKWKVIIVEKDVKNAFITITKRL